MRSTRVAIVAVLGIGLLGLACAVAQAAAPTGAPSDAALSPAGHGAASHESGNSDPLEFKKDLALWTAVVFVVLLVVLWKFAWGPIIDGLDKRERGIANEIAAAQKRNEDARALLAQYEQKLDASKDEVRAILDQARREAEGTGRKIVEVAHDEAKAEHRRALAEIDRATDNALKELAQRSADLAVQLAGKIVRAELRPADHARLLDEAVANFAGNGSKERRSV